jgi:hypothetical protein
MLSNYPEPWTASTWIIYLLVLGCYFGVLYLLSARRAYQLWRIK